MFSTTLLNNLMKIEKPNGSLIPIEFVTHSTTSLAVEAESTST